MDVTTRPTSRRSAKPAPISRHAKSPRAVYAADELWGPMIKTKDLRRIQKTIYERAKARGLVSQTEMLARLEDDFEKRLEGWEYTDGENAGGDLLEP